jgi:chromosome segregation ATPase
MASSDSDDEPAVPAAQLEQSRDALAQCATLLGRAELAANPSAVLTLIRDKLTDQRQRASANRGLNDSIAKLTALSPCTPSTLKALIAAKSRDERAAEDRLAQLDRERQSLESRLEAAKRACVRQGESMSVAGTIRPIAKQLETETAAVQGLQKEEKELSLKAEAAARGVAELRQALLDEQMKRRNIQHAIDSLRAEEEKRLTARSSFLREKKASLAAKVTEISEQRSGILKENERIQHLRNEIERFTALIAMETKRIELPVVQEVEKPPVNKDRVGRLILMLLSRGESEAVVQSLGEELDWTPKQTGDFLALVRGGSERGLGAQWAEWLNSLVSEN